MDKEMVKLVRQEFAVPATRYIARLLEKVPRSHRAEALKWLANEVIDAIARAKKADAEHKEALDKLTTQQ